MAFAIPSPSRMPRAPPARQMSTVSMRNWTIISPFVAPMARRMPISRVRSETLANIMFMIPIPPTSREMPAIEPITMLKSR